MKMNMEKTGIFALVRCEPGRTTPSSAILNPKCGSSLKEAPVAERHAANPPLAAAKPVAAAAV